MDYLTYESFIHPDVLTAFLIKDDDVTLTVSGSYEIGAETITLSTVDKVFAGDKFVISDTIYTIRTVDTIRNQIIINALVTSVVDGATLKIQKEDKRVALQNFYDIGERDYSTFANSLTASGVLVRFDADVYILKRAFIAMYGWILQNKAFLRNLNLSGLGIQKSDIFQHFSDLLESEKKDLESIRAEAMEEVKRRQQYDADGKSGNGFLRYTIPSKTYFGGYFNGRRW